MIGNRMSDKRVDLPATNTERLEAAAVRSPSIAPNQPQTIIPLLSAVVIPGAALAEAAKSTLADAPSAPAEDTARTEQQLFERLIPKIGALLEGSVHEALSGAGQQIVRGVLTQLYQHISTMSEKATITSMPQAPEKS